MNNKWKSLTFKLWLTIITAIILSVLFAYSLSQYYYKNLYVEKLKTDLVNEASLLGKDYTGGDINDDFKEKVEWFNSKNESEVFVVNNPRELSACLPFEINYDTLISEEERQMLLNGKAVEKEGYEKRFGKNIVAAIIPLIDDDHRLEGIIYTYVSVDSITDLLKEFAAKWLVAILLFLIIAIYFTTKWLKKLVSPIKEIETAAHRVSEGDYDIQLQVKSHDEIGKLAQAFNDMANSIHLEEERKKEFLENVAHELRTPLSYVKGYTHAILDGVVKNEEERKYLQLISREALRLQRIVGDLLDLSKVDGDSFQICKTPIAFAQFIEDVLAKYEPIIKEKQLALEYELDPDPIIYGDEGRMEQILHNIIDNAIQYTNHGGSIHITLIQQNEECELSISDTGTGIPKADLPYVMNRFYRVNKARSRFDGGSGLGLSIVKKMVEWQHGKIEIQSKEKIGTKVKIILPTIKEEWTS